MTQPDFSQLREAIDAIDTEILALVEQRAKVVLQVGELKRAHGIPVYDAAREREIVGRLSARAKPPLAAESVRRIFERLIDECRGMEQHYVATQ